MTDEIQVVTEGDVTTVTINRESRRNALDHHAVSGLRDALRRIADSDTKVVVLTGAGTQSFCAGDDIKAYADRTAEQSKAHFERGLKLMGELADLPCLTIAAIEGYCIGGGLELALNCDLRFASETSQFSLPEVRKLKANPTWGGLTKLATIIGIAEAKRMVFLGERLAAQEACKIGLVHRVLAEHSVLEASREIAHDVAADIDLAVLRDAKAILHAAAGGDTASLALLNLLAERAQPFQG